MQKHRPRKTYEGALLQVTSYRLLQSAANALLSQYEIVTAQWIILGYLYEQAEPQRFSDLARMLRVENPLVTRLMEYLVAQEWVQVSTAQNDKRTKLAVITDKGRLLVDEIEVRLYRHLHEAFAGLSMQELERYFDTLEKIAKSSNN